MKMQQVSENCFAVLNEKNLVCDANSGLINLGGGVVIDTQSYNNSITIGSGLTFDIPADAP